MSRIAERRTTLDPKCFRIERRNDGSISLHIYHETPTWSGWVSTGFLNNGSSPHTLKALNQLFEAINLDNERDEEGWIDVQFVSEWDGGITCTGDARVNPITKDVDVLASAPVDGVETLDRQYVVFPDQSEANVAFDGEGRLKLVS